MECSSSSFRPITHNLLKHINKAQLCKWGCTPSRGPKTHLVDFLEYFYLISWVTKLHFLPGTWKLQNYQNCVLCSRASSPWRPNWPCFDHLDQRWVFPPWILFGIILGRSILKDFRGLVHYLYTFRTIHILWHEWRVWRVLSSQCLEISPTPLFKPPPKFWTSITSLRTFPFLLFAKNMSNTWHTNWKSEKLPLWLSIHSSFTSQQQCTFGPANMKILELWKHLMEVLKHMKHLLLHFLWSSRLGLCS